MGCPNFFKYHPDATFEDYCNKFGYDAEKLKSAVKKTSHYSSIKENSGKEAESDEQSMLRETLLALDKTEIGEKRKLTDIVYESAGPKDEISRKVHGLGNDEIRYNRSEYKNSDKLKDRQTDSSGSYKGEKKSPQKSENADYSSQKDEAVVKDIGEASDSLEMSYKEQPLEPVQKASAKDYHPLVKKLDKGSEIPIFKNKKKDEHQSKIHEKEAYSSAKPLDAMKKAESIGLELNEPDFNLDIIGSEMHEPKEELKADLSASYETEGSKETPNIENKTPSQAEPAQEKLENFIVDAYVSQTDSESADIGSDTGHMDAVEMDSKMNESLSSQPDGAPSFVQEKAKGSAEYSAMQDPDTERVAHETEIIDLTDFIVDADGPQQYSSLRLEDFSQRSLQIADTTISDSSIEALTEIYIDELKNGDPEGMGSAAEQGLLLSIYEPDYVRYLLEKYSISRRYDRDSSRIEKTKTQDKDASPVKIKKSRRGKKKQKEQKQKELAKDHIKRLQSAVLRRLGKKMKKYPDSLILSIIKEYIKDMARRGLSQDEIIEEIKMLLHSLKKKREAELSISMIHPIPAL